MRLADGRQWFDVLEAAKALASRTAPFALPALAVSDVFGFLALRETVHCPPLQALADACVADLDPFRAPPSEAELGAPPPCQLTPQQDAMLLRWGYPYVFETWFFHMTLTRRLNAAEKALYQPAAEQYFAPMLAHAAPCHRHLPVRAAGAGRTLRHCRTPEAARLSASRNRATPTSRIASFSTVSAATAAGMGTVRVKRAAMSVAASRPRAGKPRGKDVWRCGHLDHAHRKMVGGIGDDGA